MEFRELTLPAYWTTYLINGDSSSLQDSEIETIDRFIETEQIRVLCTKDDSDPFFAWTNDANNLGGDCLVYQCECID